MKFLCKITICHHLVLHIFPEFLAIFSFHSWRKFLVVINFAHSNFNFSFNIKFIEYLIFSTSKNSLLVSVYVMIIYFVFQCFCFVSEKDASNILFTFYGSSVTWNSGCCKTLGEHLNALLLFSRTVVS